VPAYDLAIKNGRLVTERGTVETTVLVSDGRIAAITKSALLSQQAGSTIDARGMLVLPGLIDSHVHFRDPGMTQKEDFESGSRGAAAGGVTTVFDMPTTKPVVMNVSLFKRKVETLLGRSVVDFGLYAGAGPSNLRELNSLAAAGAVAFKTYQVAPPPERVAEYEGAFVNNPTELSQVMGRVAKTGLVHCLHAEDNQTISHLTARLLAEGRKDPMAHYDCRPNYTEALAVSQAVELARATRCKVHILHLSTKEALRIIAKAKRRKVGVTSETCPHYLIFTKDALRKFGPFAKYNPPPRTKEDVSALWLGLKSGAIDAVVSDHAPHVRLEKEAGREDIWKAPPGTPGVELRLPLLLTSARKHGLSLHDVVRLTSTGVARIFGVHNRKGGVRKGLDADFAIVDPRKEWVVKNEELQTKARETSLYGGFRMRGKVVTTILRGKVVFEEGVGFTSGLGEMIPGARARAKLRDA
jgi:allantoinase